MKGTYVLELVVEHSARIEVGALGAMTFDPGRYAYVGSAFGPGGLGRVDRHRELAAGERDVRHWHVDYLLGHPATALARVVTVPDENRECELARTLPGEPVPAFGASDCDCETHLLGCRDGATIEAAVDAGGVLEE